MTLTLANHSGKHIVIERRELVSVVASRFDDTLIRLTDGRRLFVRESLVDVLERWRGDRFLA